MIIASVVHPHIEVYASKVYGLQERSGCLLVSLCIQLPEIIFVTLLFLSPSSQHGQQQQQQQQVHRNSQEDKEKEEKEKEGERDEEKNEAEDKEDGMK